MDNTINEDRPLIREVIVVEGRDDTAAINRAVRAVTIETHGFGISEETWERLESAYRTHGLIIFTDPDHAGEKIRRRLAQKFPGSRQAFLTVDKARNKEDVGIENASPADIREALAKARCTEAPEPEEPYTMKDLEDAGLAGCPDSAARREKLGDILGTGYANSKGLLKRLNGMAVPREDLRAALRILDGEE